MERFITNKRGITLPGLMIYIVFFIIVLMFSSGMILDVNTIGTINKGKLMFNKDKEELFKLIEIDSNNIDSSRISIEPAVTGIGDKLVYIVNDLVNTPDDDSVKVEIIQGEKGLAMKRTTPSTSTNPEDSSFIVFNSITKAEFYNIDKVCTDETVATGCIDVSNLYEVIVYGEEKVSRRHTMNRAKRSFYFHE